MLFNSLHFAFFFPIATIVYWTLPKRHRQPWVLACSFYFYAVYRIAYVPILVALILLDFSAAKAMARLHGRNRKLLLVASVIGNIGALALFKYADFLGMASSDLLAAFGVHWRPPSLGWGIPLGLSFHTFQSLGYVIEVYRGRTPENNLGCYATFVMFFPQLVAGPIERADGLLEQLASPRELRADTAAHGLQLMAWGFFQKMAIADRLAAYANAAYSDPRAFNGAALFIATLFFSFQIYCDFCGYTNIAIGAAEVFGCRLMKNFDAPYFASSLTEFWRRWHISLSSWFRDYVYIPLGGGRGEFHRRLFNVMTVFLLSGLWHGASWTFVTWGFLHGTWICAELCAGRLKLPRPPAWLSIPATFAATTTAWIFFRAASLEDAFLIIFKIIRSSGAGELPEALRQFNLPGGEFAIALTLIAVLVGVDAYGRSDGIRQKIACWPSPVRWTFYYAACAALLLLARFDERPFILETAVGLNFYISSRASKMATSGLVT